MLHFEAGMVPLQLPQSFQIRYHATVQLTWVVVFDKSVPIFRAPTTEQNRMNYQSLCDFLHLYPRQVTQAYRGRFKLLAVAAYFPRAYHFSHSTPPLVRDVCIIGGVSQPGCQTDYKEIAGWPIKTGYRFRPFQSGRPFRQRREVRVVRSARSGPGKAYGGMRPRRNEKSDRSQQRTGTVSTI